MVFHLEKMHMLDFTFECHAAMYPHRFDTQHQKMILFKKMFGSEVDIVTIVWNDLARHQIVTNKKHNIHSLKKFLMAVRFLWAYERNVDTLAAEFKLGASTVSHVLWEWVGAIAALAKVKIQWPEDEYNNPQSQVFVISVDGTDFRTWESKHPTMPYDKGTYSHKFNHGALKYEIAMDVFRSRVVWISKTYRGGEHDKRIFADALAQKIPNGKKVIVDRVYGSQEGDPIAQCKLSLPSKTDAPELAKFKARVRARHETFNGRLKFFRCLSDTYKHSKQFHQIMFESVVVLVQYQMDNGHPLFDP